MAIYARKLSDAIDKETQRLTKLTELAIDRKSSERAIFYLGQIVLLNPEASTLCDLQKRIKKMKEKNKPQELNIKT